jgi:hypothetical protein
VVYERGWLRVTDDLVEADIDSCAGLGLESDRGVREERDGLQPRVLGDSSDCGEVFQ